MYIDKTFSPDDNFIIAKYKVWPKHITIEEACEAIAGESSIGTWTELTTITDEVKQALKPHVFDTKNNIIEIAYPQLLFEKSSIPQLLSSIAGNIYGMKSIEGLKLIDIKFPEPYVKSFPGPRFGSNGVRTKLNIHDRPLLGTIVKPKVGLKPKEFANVVYNSLIGGLDFVKDDENLTSLEFCSFEERIKYVLEAVDKAEVKTNEKKAFLPNITAPYDIMLKRAEFVKSLGSKYMMVDVVTSGNASLQALRKHGPELIIHAHRAGYAAFTRPERYGMTTYIFSKILRLIGVDQLHIGTVVGKMEGNKEEILSIHKTLSQKHFQGNSDFYEQNWYDLKSVFSVASGGLHPFLIPDLYKIFGKEAIFMFGGGVHGHPDGSEMGAKTVRTIMEDVIAGKDINTNINYIAHAFSKWGKKRWDTSS